MGQEPLFQRDHLASDTFRHQDMVCAVCRSKPRVSQVKLHCHLLINTMVELISGKEGAMLCLLAGI